MCEKRWQDIAWEALKEPEEQISAKPSEITRIGAPVVALAGTLIAAVLGAEFNFDPKQAETVIAAAIIVSISIAAVVFAYTSDFRTRGRLAAARFDALARIVEAEIEGARKLRAAEPAAPSMAKQETDAAKTKLAVPEAPLDEFARALVARVTEALSGARNTGAPVT
jgi:hypothetical protein